MTEPSTYPADLVGDDTTPPRRPSARVVDLARRAADRAAPAELETPPPLGLPPWRMAASLVVLISEANAANPGRDKRSDGTIVGPSHTTDSDHYPWREDRRGMGVVRAADLDASGLDLGDAFERLRVAAYRGQLPQVVDGGYAIYARKITKADWSGWAEYHGDNDHVLHGHVSVSVLQDRYDDRRTWGIFGAVDDDRPAPPRPPSPAKPEPVNVRWLEVGEGHYREADPRHRATRRLQAQLRRRYPAYAGRLSVDGLYGPATAAAVREFQRRSRITPNGIAGPVTLRRLGL